MIRISRLTDYGIVLMSHRRPTRSAFTTPMRWRAMRTCPADREQAARLSLLEGLPSRTAASKAATAWRAWAEEITVGSIKALEAHRHTTCTTNSPGDREHELVCPVRGHWYLINLAVRQALDSVTVADMAAHPRPLHLPTLGRPRPTPCAPAASE